MKYRDLFISPKYSEGEKVYFGNVSGVPEIETIEAANLDDFERLFHEAVDEYYLNKHDAKSHSKTRLFVAIITLLILLSVALITCPDADKHKRVFSDRISAATTKSYTDKYGTTDDEYAGLNALIGNYGGRLVGAVAKNFMTVKDYGVFSLGYCFINSEKTLASIGVFGHVFTISERRLIEAIGAVAFSLN